jgi:PAS domain-containing protein
MTWSFFASKDLRARLSWLRRVLPFGVAFAVVLYEFANFIFLRDFPSFVHLIIDLILYATVGPIAIWFAINWITQRVEESEDALAAKARAEAEQQRAIEAAREQERLLATVCSNSADAIITIDNEGIIKTWNRGAEMMFGYQADEVIGKHFQNHCPSRY